MKHLKLATFHSKEQWQTARTKFNSDSRLLEALSPHQVEPTPPRQSIKIACLTGAAVGLATAFIMQYYSSVIDTPLVVGGRPLFSWQAWIPVCFVLTILGAGLASFGTLFWKLRLPWLSHPVFHARSFDFSKPHFYLLFEVQHSSTAQPLLQELELAGANFVEDIEL